MNGGVWRGVDASPVTGALVFSSHMPLSPAADTKHDRPRQQAVTNGNPTGSAVARDDDGDDTPPGNSIVVRIGIPDLQQTVTRAHKHAAHRILDPRHKPVRLPVCLFLCLSVRPSAALSEVFAVGPRVTSLDQ